MKNNNGMWLATGLLIGNLVGMGLLYIYERWEENTTPVDVVCQKGMSYEQASYGSGVYLRTDTECLNIDFIGGE